MSGEIIKIESLDCFYGKHKVLDDINLTFDGNGFYGIIGPNGSGKTTLIKNICRSIMPKSGTIYFRNRDITEFSNKELAREISYVPQSTDLEFEFSVMDMVLMGRSPYLRRFQAEGSFPGNQGNDFR